MKPRHKEIITNWNVITGGPCSGKTTTVNKLAGLGFKTTIEHARHYIEMQQVLGRDVHDIKKNRKQFQLNVLQMQIEEEKALNPEDVVFLDRALPDAMAYFKFFDIPFDQLLIDQCNLYCYNTVFILDRLPLVNDYARLENEEEQERLQNLITEVYKGFPCTIVHVPVLEPDERVGFIIDHSSEKRS